MTSPLHAQFYADSAVQQTVEIIENVRLAKKTHRVRFRSPEIASRILPGQFLMLRLTDLNDPLIGRPLAMYDVTEGASGEPEFVDVVYLVKGKLSSRLQDFRPGQRLDVWGPLGNGFLPQPTVHLIMVAGGIGQTPFLCWPRRTLGSRDSEHRRERWLKQRELPFATEPVLLIISPVWRISSGWELRYESPPTMAHRVITGW